LLLFLFFFTDFVVIRDENLEKKIFLQISFSTFIDVNR
jgi:hypothetical protein